MADVYICATRANNTLADAVKRELSSYPSISVEVQNNLDNSLGELWPTVLANIDAAAVAVMLWDATSHRDPALHAAGGYASASGKRIVLADLGSTRQPSWKAERVRCERPPTGGPWPPNDALRLAVLRQLDVAKSQSGPPPNRWPSLSVFAPSRAKAGTDFLIQAAVHNAKHTEMVARLAREADPASVRRGSRTLAMPINTPLELQFVCEQLECDEDRQVITWTGEPAFADFVVRSKPRLCALKTYAALHVSAGGVPIGKLTFSVELGRGVRESARVEHREWLPHRYAFLSYAHEDRAQVNAVSKLLDSVGLPHFIDVDSLRSGDDWQWALRQHVGQADVFLLFWSQAAARSHWVAQECAWAQQIRDAAPDHRPSIHPHIIGPDAPPPPPELRHLHFGRL